MCTCLHRYIPDTGIYRAYIQGFKTIQPVSNHGSDRLPDSSAPSAASSQVLIGCGGSRCSMVSSSPKSRQCLRKEHSSIDIVNNWKQP